MARPHELLLLQNVENLGIIGDVVSVQPGFARNFLGRRGRGVPRAPPGGGGSVKPGFARNFLLPRGIAIPPTPEKVAELAGRRAEVEAELKALAAKQAAMIEKLHDHEITLERSANDQGVLFGGVTQHEIAEILREQGFEIEDRYVRLGEQIKRLDSYHIPVIINKELKTEIKLWVVSDRPMDHDEEPENTEEGDAQQEGHEVETPQADSE